MNNKLMGRFNELKNLTNEAIEAVQKEDYDKLNSIMKERKKVIDDIAVLGCSKEELKSVYNESNILEMENELSNFIKRKEAGIKSKLGNLIKASSITGNYYSRFNKKAVIFSKKV